jgi:hypothetical protein
MFYPTRIRTKVGQGVFVIGGAAIILKRIYDPDQGWFPFMDGAIFIKPPEPSQPKTVAAKANVARLDRRNLKRRLGEPFVIVPIELQNLYPPEFHHDQLRLPFQRHRQLSNENLASLKQQGFPEFERTTTGEIARVEFPKRRLREVREWCEEVCQHYYHISPMRSVVTFQSLTEACAAKLVFYEPGGALA